MIFVPLPLFATLLLTLAVAFLWQTRDMRVLPNQVFAALVALYAVQSLLLSLRWGYGIDALRPVLEPHRSIGAVFCRVPHARPCHCRDAP